MDWAFDLRGIKQGYALKDTPEGFGIAYEAHIYPWKNNKDSMVLAVKDIAPIIVGEFGITPEDRRGAPGAAKAPGWLPDLLDWMDKNELNWAAWCFHTGAGLPMLKNDSFEPTDHFGLIVKERLLSYPATVTHF